MAILPIRSAILRLDPTSSTFTSSHLVFARLCLEARAFQAALPVLDNDIFHFPPISEKAAANTGNWFPCSQHETSSTFITIPLGLTEKLDYRDHLEYFLFGAMIYMGLKNWERAQLFLEMVIVSPTTSTASMIQVHAYKKWVLVNLIYKGGVSRFVLNIKLTCTFLIGGFLAIPDAKDNKWSSYQNLSRHCQSVRQSSRSFHCWNIKGDNSG